MKIAFAIEHFSPDQGGAEQYAWGFAKWLVDTGHELDVFTFAAPRHATFVSGLHVLELAGGRATRQKNMARALQAALARRRYDVVQGFNHVRPCDVLRLGGGVHLAFEHYNALSASSWLARNVRAWSYRALPHYRAVRENEALQFDDPRRRFIAVSRRVGEVWVLETLQAQPEATLAQIATALQCLPMVQYADPVLRRFRAAGTNDPYFGEQWGLTDPTSGIGIEAA